MSLIFVVLSGFFFLVGGWECKQSEALKNNSQFNQDVSSNVRQCVFVNRGWKNEKKKSCLQDCID